MPLYLLRSSKFREFHQENLRLLRSAVGSEHIIRYSMVWVDPALRKRDLTGQEAIIVLADKPYRRFAPIRLGKVSGIHDEGERLEISLKLGGWPLAGLDMNEFNNWLADRLEKRQALVMAIEEERFIQGEEPEKRVIAWKASIDRILSSDSQAAYEKTAFFLPLGLFEGDKEQEVESGLLHCGKEYTQYLHSYNPHLSKQHLDSLRFKLSYDATEIEELMLPKAVQRDGKLGATFRVLVPGTANMDLFVIPFGEQSTRLPFEYHAIQTDEPVFKVAEKGPDLARLARKLMDVMDQENMFTKPEFGKNTLSILLELSPDDQKIARKLAHLYFESGNYKNAWKTFDGLGEEKLESGDWLPYFLSACRCGRPKKELGTILDHLPWDMVTSEIAKRIGDAVSKRSEGDILAILEPLAYYYTENFLEDVWYRIRSSIKTADGILKAHEILQNTHMESDSGAYQYLYERSNEERIIDARIDERLVEHGLNMSQEPEGFKDVLERRFRQLLRDGRLQDIRQILYSLRSNMTAMAYQDITWRLIELFSQSYGKKEEDKIREFQAELLAEKANKNLSEGDIESAEENLKHAFAAFPESKEAEKIRKYLLAAQDQTEELMKKRNERIQAKVDTLRDKLSGKKLVIVGCPDEKAWKEDIRKKLALSDIEWITTSVGKTPGTSRIPDAIGENTAVVVVFGYINHVDAGAAKKKADQLKIPYVFMGSVLNKDRLLNTLFDAFEQYG